MRDGFLSFLLTVIGRLMIRRDRLSGRMQMLSDLPVDAERLVISNGKRRLSAVYLSAGDDTSAILICHGIGELVEYWGNVQGLLRDMGVSSLVFNYSGYGASSGRVSTAHCEQDAIAAYGELVSRGHSSIVLLGFSLGSGVACAVASRIDVRGLVLCEGFSTLREAATAMGFSRLLTSAAANVWDTVHRVRELEVPVLIVHSDEDGLLPLSMAKQVAEACGARGELVVVSGFTHDAPYSAPTEVYWGPIVEWSRKRSSEVSSSSLPAVRS